MKRLLTLLLVLFMIGCRSQEEIKPTPEPTGSPDVFGVQDDSYTMAVLLEHHFSYTGTGVTEDYRMDGVLQAVPEQETAHITVNTDSAGIRSALEGWYEDGRLYSSYNGVEYYDTMGYEDVPNILLVSGDPAEIRETDCTEIREEENGNEKTVTYQLKADAAERLYTQRYDIYDLSQSGGFEVSEGTIVQTWDDEQLAREDAIFTLKMAYAGNPVEIAYHSEVRYLLRGETAVIITGEMKERFREYVSFEDIDTSSIAEQVGDDTAGATAEETFRKRLTGRLNYQIDENGIYTSDFNEDESYLIDFRNHLFTYRNRTSTYVYNWASDSGGFGSSCVYDFSRSSGSESCQASVIETIRDVKVYFELELYYCGLTLEDLTAEISG